jgi:hypothetical protein
MESIVARLERANAGESSLSFSPVGKLELVPETLAMQDLPDSTIRILSIRSAELGMPWPLAASHRALPQEEPEAIQPRRRKVKAPKGTDDCGC